MTVATMSNVLAGTSFGGAVATAEATVPDLKLAEALGYARPGDIRKLIKRHAETLELFGSLRHRGVMIEAGKGARREVREYQLTKAQAAFLIAKSDTKRALSLTVFMAETFAMVSDGKLIAADQVAAEELAAAQAREKRRRHEEERDARSAGFAALRFR